MNFIDIKFTEELFCFTFRKALNSKNWVVKPFNFMFYIFTIEKKLECYQ